jgi:hypothetical protein
VERATGRTLPRLTEYHFQRSAVCTAVARTIALLLPEGQSPGLRETLSGKSVYLRNLIAGLA